MNENNTINQINEKYAKKLWELMKKYVVQYFKLMFLKDYIVEQGTSGIWTYRKWASGIAECWGSVTKTYSFSINENDKYYNSGNLTQAKPTGINNIIGFSSCNEGWGWSEFKSSDANNIHYRLYSSQNINKIITVNFYLKGTWK